jgi:hypothetical protein
VILPIFAIVMSLLLGQKIRPQKYADNYEVTKVIRIFRIEGFAGLNAEDLENSVMI